MSLVKPRALAGFASAITIAVGTLALLGWLLDLGAFRSVLPGLAPMHG
jgi:hypothetical protein